MKSLPIDKNFTINYINSLVKFVSFILSSGNRQNSNLYVSMGQFKKTLTTTSKQLKNKYGVSKEINIDGFSVPITNKLSNRSDPNKLSVYVGGKMEFDNSVLVNQSICFSIIYYVQKDMDEETAYKKRCHPYKAGAHVLRKFHFDIDRNADSNRPLSHLQYGGSFKPEHFSVCVEGDDELDYRLFSNLDDPRLPAIPYGFATCLDIIFRTFNTKASSLSEEGWWKNQVVESEKMWLMPFFQTAVEAMGQCGKETFYEFMTKKA